LPRKNRCYHCNRGPVLYLESYHRERRHFCAYHEQHLCSDRRKCLRYIHCCNFCFNSPDSDCDCQPQHSFSLLDPVGSGDRGRSGFLLMGSKSRDQRKPVLSIHHSNLYRNRYQCARMYQHGTNKHYGCDHACDPTGEHTYPDLYRAHSHAFCHRRKQL
jgi:hypothetical protein